MRIPSKATSLLQHMYWALRESNEVSAYKLLFSMEMESHANLTYCILMLKWLNEGDERDLFELISPFGNYLADESFADRVDVIKIARKW